MRDKKIGATFFTRESYREYKGYDASGKGGLMLALLATAPRARRAFNGTALYGQCNLPETRRTFFSFPFLFCLLRRLYLFLHEGISHRREIDRILCAST